MVDQIFSICSSIAMLGWLALVVLPRQPFVVRVLARLLIPGAIALVYAGLMAFSLGAMPEGGGFGSLAEIKRLFEVDQLLLAGWVHYLAFDLFVGSWEVEDSQRYGLSHWLVLPALALTLLAGPLGLLIYLLLRTLFGRKPQDADPAVLSGTSA